MHTQEKPYQCHICTKAFARADLLKRHALGHAKDDPHAKPTIVQHSRVSQACEACAGLREFLVFLFTSLYFLLYYLVLLHFPLHLTATTIIIMISTNLLQRRQT